jgi:hypothetical protein
MFWEIFGESTDPQPMGSIGASSQYSQQKRPALVLLKFLGAAILVTVGYAMTVPFLPMLPLPLWQSVMLVTGAMLVYVGVAFFLRPEPNGDNMGWCGGMVDDPFHYSDDVNRLLFGLQMLLGPGRFVAETMLDICTLFGLVGGLERATAGGAVAPADREGFAERAYEALSEQESSHPTELSSARYWNQRS